MPYMKPGSPFLYDEATGDTLGVKDADGSETLFIGGGAAIDDATTSPTRVWSSQKTDSVVGSLSGLPTAAKSSVVAALSEVYLGHANSAERDGMSPAASASANRAALQAALNRGGVVSLTTPGMYDIGGYAQATDADFPALLSIQSNTTLYIGPGVTIRMPQTGTTNVSFCANSNIKSNAVALVPASTAIVDGAASGNRYTSVTFESSTAHGLAVGDYALVKGDTSALQWDGVYEVYAVPDSTHFTIRVYFGQTVQRVFASDLPTGSPVVYRANNNVNVVIAGVLDGRQNTTDGLSTGTGRMMVLFNKVGHATLRVPGRMEGCIVGVAASNFDSLMIPEMHYDTGSVPVWASGPFRDLQVDHGAYSGSEECVYVYNKEPTKFLFRDADGTGNTGGDIRSVIVRDMVSRHNGIRALHVGVGGGYSIGSVVMDRVHAYACGLLLEVSAPPADGGNIGNIVCRNFEHDPDPGKAGVFFNTNASGYITIKRFEISNPVTPVRPYVNAPFAQFSSTSAACSIDLMVVDGGDIIHDAGASTATQFMLDLSSGGANWTIRTLNVSGVVHKAIGTARNVHTIGVGSSFGSAPNINVTNCAHDCAVGALVRTDKTGTYKLTGNHILQNTNQGMIFSTVGCSIHMTDNYVPGGTNPVALAYLQANSQTWNLYLGGNECGDYVTKGYNGYSGNTINIFSGGGNTSAGGTAFLDSRTGTTIAFRGNCADFKFDAASAQCARTDGTIFYNTNAAAGSLGAAGLVSSQGTAVGSWHLMADPTKVY